MLAEILKILSVLSSLPLGPLIISFISNSIPFVSLPYLLIILSYAISYPGIYDKIIIIVSSALGATLGKLVIYTLGRGASRALGPVSRRNAELFSKIAKKSVTLAIFLFAALPLPDDVLYLPLGVTGFPILSYFLAVFLGKVFLKSAVVFYGSIFTVFSDAQGYQTVPFFAFISILITYYIIKIDWTKVLEVHMDRGFRASATCFLEELNSISKKLVASVKVVISRIL